MNDRQRFNATMHYQPRDRAPICDFGFWPETIVEWKKQGLPDWVGGGHDTTTTNQYFGMDSYTGGPSANVFLLPAFESKVIREEGDYQLIQQDDGVLVKQHKSIISIPEHVSHLLTDRASWEKHFRWRLDPSTPARLPQGQEWEQALRVWRDKDRENIVCLWGGSTYGWVRNWMGMENTSYLVYDDPALFEEMIVTITDCIVGTLEKVMAIGGVFDACGMWEDMCYNAGPLLGVEHFKKYLVPAYKRITGLLRRHGVDVIWLDCDGCIDELIPLWLDAGVNCMFPVEIGTWGADPVKYRRQYGRDLLMMGGFDKHILAQSPREIEKEINRLAPLVEEGGFIPFADHRVPPDVPLSNYLFYLENARKVWGHGVNLKPLGHPR